MGEPMTEQELKQIEGRALLATAGPWGIHRADEECGEIAWGVDNGHGMTVALVPEGTREMRDRSDARKDAAFIAHARADVPALVAEVRRLRALAEARGWEATELLRIVGDAAKASPEMAECLIALAGIAHDEAQRRAASGATCAESSLVAFGEAMLKRGAP